ncbi:facilitated trehalose transporter Tret1-2 homolog [Agrilus planipennis]|uniref:Facilitated trehalose transporter Tret1-2 homolog n=1 Tax=Agrilus planipennis TaxID=224129 RepID=A0A1W4WVB5_AGRPL|nr:facilitated trehalose transporter Tret1-2 homolog [Agrilus planipennis]
MKILTGCNNKTSKGNPLYQYLAMITGSLNVICSGMHFGWPSPSLPRLLREDSPVKITSDDGSWLAVMPLLGAVLGSATTSFLVERFGRKPVIFGTSIPYIITWLLVAFSPNAAMLMVARFLAGITDGFLFCTMPMYLGEIAEPRIRGTIGSSLSVNFTLGILLINIIGSFTTVKMTALISTIFPCLAAATFVFMPESPYHYIIKGQLEEAKISLRKFRGNEDVDGEVTRLMDGIKESNVKTAKFTDLFMEKSNRTALLLMMGLRAAQQFGGTSAITFYAGTIFQEAGDHISPEVASIIYFAVQLGMGCVSLMIVDITGRRPLLILSITGACIALFVEGSYFYIHNVTSISTASFSWLPVAALVFYVVIFSVGMQPIPMLILGELFSPGVKAYALGFADIYFSFLATIVSKFFQAVKDEFGIYVPFFTFSGCCILGLIFIVICFPETKGKTLEEIQQNFKGKKPTNNPTEP